MSVVTSMPSFESLILAPPSGFGVGCRALNSVLCQDPDRFTDICKSAIAVVKTGSTDVHLQSDDIDTKNAHRAACFLVRSWMASSSAGAKEIAVALDSHTSMSREVS